MILFIEDQAEIADLYLDEMKERGLEVQYFAEVDEAWSFLKSIKEPPSVAVIDIMMAHGKLFSPIATSDGLTTGLHFYKLFRSHFPRSFVLALTNLTSPVVDETLRGDERAFVRRKDKVYYDEIADEVEDLCKQMKGSSDDLS